MVKSYLKWMNGLGRLGKLLFALPILDIFWAVYRICHGIHKNSLVRVVLGIIWIFAGATILWLLDIICIILFNHICWFQD